MSKQIQIAIFAAAALVLSGGGFVAGMTVGPELGGKNEAAATGAPTGAGARQQGARAGGAAAGAGTIAIAGQGNQTAGRVISVSDGAITVEVRQPGSDTPRSVIALVGSNARVVRTTETDIKLSDIKPGDQVLVVGQTDQATGTVAATAVIDGFNALQQIFGGGPAGGARPSGASQRPSPSPSARP
jgi:hypothetical protein